MKQSRCGVIWGAARSGWRLEKLCKTAFLEVSFCARGRFWVRQFVQDADFGQGKLYKTGEIGAAFGTELGKGSLTGYRRRTVNGASPSFPEMSSRRFSVASSVHRRGDDTIGRVYHEIRHIIAARHLDLISWTAIGVLQTRVECSSAGLGLGPLYCLGQR